MGPAMRSARACRAAASMRTTFSPMRFIRRSRESSSLIFARGEKWMLARADWMLPALQRERCDSKMIIADRKPRHRLLAEHSQTLGLNYAIPRPGLPVVAQLFRLHPGWQVEHQVPARRVDVGFIHGTQLRKFLLRLVARSQPEVSGGQPLAQTVEIFIRQAVRSLRIVARVDHLRQVHCRVARHRKGQARLSGMHFIDTHQYKRRNVEHHRKRGQPGLVAMLRAKKTEYGI